MIMKYLALVLVAPTFIVPGIVIVVVGLWLGNVYMKAQLPVKRETSVAKAPVLGNFGAVMAGLGTSITVKNDLTLIFLSFNSRIWS